MKSLDDHLFKFHSQELLLSLPREICEFSRDDMKIYLNSRSGKWVCLLPDGQETLNLFNSNKKISVSEVISRAKNFVLKGTNADEVNRNIVIRHLLNSCIENDVLVVENGRNYIGKVPYKELHEIRIPELTWALAGDCNLRCKHCYRHQKMLETSEYDPELENHILAFIEKNGISVTLTGGEPLSHPRFLEYVTRLNDSSISISILTNGNLLTKEMAEVFSQCSNFKIQISLDIPVKKTHELIRGRGTYDRTIESIKLLVAKGVKVVVSMVPMKPNIHQLSQLVELAKTLGIKDLHFPMLDQTGSADRHSQLLVPTEQELFDFFDQLRTYVVSGEINNGYTSVLLDLFRGFPVSSSLNFGPGYTMVVDHKGNIYPCSGLGEDNFISGNIGKKGFFDIFLNSRAKICNAFVFEFGLTIPRAVAP